MSKMTNKGTKWEGSTEQSTKSKTYVFDTDNKYLDKDIEFTVDATPVYNSGYSAGTSAVTVSASATQGTWSSNKMTVTAKATGSNGKTDSTTTTVDASGIYSSGVTKGQNDIKNGTQTKLSQGDWSSNKLTVTASAGYNGSDLTTTVDASSIYSAGNTAGQATGKTNYEPTSATITNAGVITAKNKAGTTVLTTSAVSNSYDAGVTKGQNDIKNGTQTKLTQGSWSSNKLTVTASAGYNASALTTDVDASGIYSNGQKSVTPSVTDTKPTGTSATDKTLGYGATTYVVNPNDNSKFVSVKAPSDRNIQSSKTVTAGTSNTTVSPDTGYDAIKSVTVQPTPSQTKTATPSTSSQTISPDSGKLLSSVTVNAISTQTKSATPTTSAQTITPDSGKYLSSVTVGAIGTETKTVSVTSNGTTTVSPTSGKYLSSVTVNTNVPTSKVQATKERSLTYYDYENTGGVIDVTPDSGYDGIAKVKIVYPSNDDVNVYELMKAGYSGYVTHEDLYDSDFLPDGEEILDLYLPQLTNKSTKITDSGTYTVAGTTNQVLGKVDIDVDVKNTTYNRWAAFNWHKENFQVGDKLVCDELEASNMFNSNKTRWKLIFESKTNSSGSNNQIYVHAEKWVGNTVTKTGTESSMTGYYVVPRTYSKTHDILIYWIKPEDFLVIPNSYDAQGTQTKFTVYRYRINNDASINVYGPIQITSLDEDGNLSYQTVSGVKKCTNRQDFVMLPSICTNTIDLQFLILKRTINDVTNVISYSCLPFMLNYDETRAYAIGGWTDLGKSTQYTFGYGGGDTSTNVGYEGSDTSTTPYCWFASKNINKIIIDKNYFAWFNRYTKGSTNTYKDSTFLAGPGSSSTAGCCVYKINTASGYRPLAPILENDIQAKTCVMKDASGNKYYVIIDRETNLPRLVNA